MKTGVFAKPWGKLNLGRYDEDQNHFFMQIQYRIKVKYIYKLEWIGLMNNTFFYLHLTLLVLLDYMLLPVLMQVILPSSGAIEVTACRLALTYKGTLLTRGLLYKSDGHGLHYYKYLGDKAFFWYPFFTRTQEHAQQM